MIRLLALLIAVSWGALASAQTAIYRGKVYTPQSFSRATWCSCPMCQNIRAQWARQNKPVYTVVTGHESSPLPSIQEYTTEYRPYTVRVKRCVNGRCFYETVTRYQAVRVPVASKPPSEPKPNFLTNTELVPTPQAKVESMLRALAPKASETLLDLGCGDGRIVTTAAARYGCRSIGVELNPDSIEMANDAVAMLGLEDQVLILQGDVRKYDLSDADCIAMYLYEDLMKELVPRMKKGTRVASYMHPIPGVDCFVTDGDIYVGVVK